MRTLFVLWMRVNMDIYCDHCGDQFVIDDDFWEGPTEEYFCSVECNPYLDDWARIQLPSHEMLGFDSGFPYGNRMP